MQSLRELFRIGKGPSSSHTIGPEHASKLFLKEHPESDCFKVILYGSLAKTGDGHGTQSIIRDVLKNVDIINNLTETDIKHPNTMDFFAYKDGKETASLRVYSVGGGAIEVEGRERIVPDDVYPLESLTKIREYLTATGKTLARLCL